MQQEIRKIAKEYVTKLEAATTPKDVGTILGQVTTDSRLSLFERDHLAGQARSRVRALTGTIEHEAPEGADGGLDPNASRTPVTQGGAAIVEAPANPSGDPGASNLVLTPTKFKPMLPAIPAQQLKEAWDAWHQTATALLDRKEDVSVIHGNEYLNITFWRKIAVAYGIEAWPKQGSRKLFIDDKGLPRAEIEFVCKAPNGRTVFSFGIASKAEPRLKDASDHDLMARAWSRAFVRGMRDLVGFGEPMASAEEVE